MAVEGEAPEIIGIIELGVWTEPVFDCSLLGHRAMRMPYPRDSEAKQYAWEVRDGSYGGTANGPIIAVGVEITDGGVSLYTGQHVVYERATLGTIERTIRMVDHRVGKGTTFRQPPKATEAAVDLPQDGKPTHLIVGMHTFNQPEAPAFRRPKTVAPALDRENIARIIFLVRHAEQFPKYEGDAQFEEAEGDWVRSDNPLPHIKEKAYEDADRILALSDKTH